MDIHLGFISPDSSRYSDPQSKRAKRVETQTRHDEEAWSERSDYEEIEDCYIPSLQGAENSTE